MSDQLLPDQKCKHCNFYDKVGSQGSQIQTQEQGVCRCVPPQVNVLGTPTQIAGRHGVKLNIRSDFPTVAGDDKGCGQFSGTDEFYNSREASEEPPYRG